MVGAKIATLRKQNYLSFKRAIDKNAIIYQKYNIFSPNSKKMLKGTILAPGIF